MRQSFKILLERQSDDVKTSSFIDRFLEDRGVSHYFAGIKYYRKSLYLLGKENV